MQRGASIRSVALTASLLLAFLARSAPAAVASFAEVRAGWRPSEAYLLDRTGQVIHTLRVDLSARRLEWTRLADLSPAFLRAVIRAEDRRFFDHSGVDWRAAARALLGTLIGERSRGASTLTMQLAAMLEPALKPGAGRRGFVEKLVQMRAGLALDEHWLKHEVLEAYVNLASYYGELQGIAAAAQGLFGKRPSGLSEAESALLAALLAAPNRRGARLGMRACAIAGLTPESPRCAELMRLALALSDAPNPRASTVAIAPHLAHALLRRPGERVRTTLDGRIQRLAVEALDGQLRGLGSHNVRDGAVLVADNASGAVLAYVGAAAERSSAVHVDGVRARRQAGSTLKPFLYELAIEKRYITAATLIDDSPIKLETSSGLYIPQNYDQDYKGLVSVRTALAASLNVPAVRTLVLTGVEPFRDRLHALGYRGITQAGEYYGFALALGSAEVSLWEQVGAYRALATGGRYGELSLAERTGRGLAIMSPEAAYIVADILSDRGGRAVTFGLDNPLATRYWTGVKTGTSKNMRDNWCIGFSPNYTIGVWVGNFEGDSMQQVSGVTGAAPVWLALMNALHADAPPAPIASGVRRRTIRYEPAIEPSREEWFITGTESEVIRLPEPGRRRARIDAPPDGVIIAFDPDIPLPSQRVLLSADAPPDARLVLDGRTLEGMAQQWQPVPGEHRLSVVARDGRAQDSIRFRVRGATSQPVR